MLIPLQTLAEQMQMSERELEQRKALVQFGQDDVDCLRAHRGFIAGCVDDVVSEFYDKQLAIPEISAHIGDADTMGRLRRALRRYVIELFDGFYDLNYVNKRLRIGKVHKQMSVPPKFFISAIWLLEKILQEKITEYTARIAMAELGEKLRNALHKLLVLDTQFVFDTYVASLITEISIAKEQMEQQIAKMEMTISERTRELENLSRRDGLTELWNQQVFYERLHHELALSERYKEHLSLAYLDIDGFKTLNDTHGHVTGDQTLILLAVALKQSVRECDIPCRVGGDEFAVIFPKTTLEDASQICERIVERLKKSELNQVTVSIGLATAGNDYYPQLNDFIREADRNMYSSKSLSTSSGSGGMI